VEKIFHDLRVETLVQATEDREKVILAVQDLLGSDKVGEIEFFPSEGVYGNPIELMIVTIKKQREIKEVLNRWKDLVFWKKALGSMEDRLDEDNTFHVRVDKDSAFDGKPEIWTSGSSIQIRLKVATFPASREGSLKILEALLD
jgi:RNA binding exosome subunit